MGNRSNDQRVWQLIWFTAALEVINVVAGLVGLPTNASIDFMFGGTLSALVADRAFFNKMRTREDKPEEKPEGV